MNFHQPLIGWQWGGNRMGLAVKLATGKSVLHVGCVDEGMVSRETLHQKLGKVASQLYGVDVVVGGDMVHDFQADEWPHFADLARKQLPEAVNLSFDIVICTETIEHLDNLGNFLDNLRSVGSARYFFSAPNALGETYRNQLVASTQDGAPVELVHEDHRCYFSPFTLENVLRKHGYATKDRFMVGWHKPNNIFLSDGVAILCE